MKRLLLAFIPIFTLFALSEIVLAEPTFQEGKAYKHIVPEQPTISGDKVEVVELFWYGCPHCHRFQPFVEKWLENKSDNIVYIRMPAILRDSWTILARAFYTAQALGKLEEIHLPLFNAIHNEKRKFNTEQALSEFFAEYGVSPEDFRKTFHSFSVDNKVRRARLMTKRYQTQGTPTVIINGKYRTDPGMTNGFTNMISVIDYLAKIENGGQP
jgi:thiol:disulfide interchange protein DsbA